MIKLHALWPNGSSTGVPWHIKSRHLAACCRNGTKTARKDPKRIRDAERFTQEPRSEHGQRHKQLLLSGICSSFCPALISSNNAFLVLTEFCGSLEVHKTMREHGGVRTHVRQCQQINIDSLNYGREYSKTVYQQVYQPDLHMLEDSKGLRAVTATQQLSVSHELMVQPAMHRRRKTSPKEAGRAAQREEGTATQHRNHGKDEDGLNTKVNKTRSDNK